MVFAFLFLLQATADPAALLQQGKLPEAERVLRAQLAKSPGDARSLMLLAVVLDSQQRFDESEPVHHRATKAAPAAPPVWNNFGNHWLTRGRLDDARRAFERVLALDASHPNATLQLGRIAVEQRRFPEARVLLERAGAAQTAEPAVQALYGRALAGTGDYAAAEKMFAAALERAPADFDLLVNLGLAALNAGNRQRALEALETARRQQPENPDALVALGRAYAESGQLEPALIVIGEARRIAPKREDVIALLARTASLAGFHADSAQAWEEFLKLQPASAPAQRERAFSWIRAGNAKLGLPLLEEYVKKNPGDAMGHFQLGVAISGTSPVQALPYLSKAIALDPGMADAYHVRGAVLFQDGKAAEAIPDLERARKLQPDNPRVLDRLGQAYRAAGRSEEAEPVLRRAAELAPDDGPTAMHLALVLRDNGKREESQKWFARFRELGENTTRRVQRSGLLEYLNLTPDQRREQTLANLRRALADQPANADIRVRLGSMLLETGAVEEAEKVFSELTDAAAVQRAAEMLIEAGRYASAKTLLGRSGAPSVNLAIAVSHSDGTDAGLAMLDRMPEAARDGDYWLARAEVLDRSGRFEDAVAALNRALAAAPTRADLYHHAATFLLKHKRWAEAESLLKQALERVPDAPELQLDQAISLELQQRFGEARALLAGLQRRYPEWSRPWAVHGISFMSRGKALEALPLLETAIALGDESAETRYYLAEALIGVSKDNLPRARQEVQRAVADAPDDPFIRTLAGRIELESGDAKAALPHLLRAVELRPDESAAHYQLMRTYSALGEKEKAAEEAALVKQLEAPKN